MQSMRLHHIEGLQDRWYSLSLGGLGSLQRLRSGRQMNIAVYLRVSTDQQTVDNQRPDIEAYLLRFPGATVTYYEENESAWKAGHQRELARLKQDIRSGKRKLDLMIVWAFDRLTREGGMALIREYDFFLEHEIKLISIKESWSDVPRELLPFMLALFGYLAQKESTIRSERTRAGLARVNAAGSKSGIGVGKRGPDKGRRKKSGYYERWKNKGKQRTAQIQAENQG